MRATRRRIYRARRAARRKAEFRRQRAVLFMNYWLPIMHANMQAQLEPIFAFASGKRPIARFEATR